MLRKKVLATPAAAHGGQPQGMVPTRSPLPADLSSYNYYTIDLRFYFCYKLLLSSEHSLIVVLYGDG